MTGPAILVVTFAAMEAVSYATHRWVMHGRGMAWHASHHAPPRGSWERNDLFPVCFSIAGFTLFVLVALGVLPDRTWWLAAGVAAYGLAYLVVHDVFIHRRLGWRRGEGRYVRWLRRSHRAHHVDGGEPYGMLLPLMTRRRRDRIGPRPAGEPDRLVRAGSGRWRSR
jgi:beta-carotene 3-hydroxylase